MRRSELFDKSLEREGEYVKKKIDSRKIKHKIFQKTNYIPFPFLLIIRRVILVS